MINYSELRLDSGGTLYFKIAKLIEWLIVILALVIPLHGLISSIISIVLFAGVLICVLLFGLRLPFKPQFSLICLILFSLFYLAHIVGVFYSCNMSFALFDLQVKLSLIAFPVVFFLISAFFPGALNPGRTLIAFATGVVIGSLIMIISAVVSYSATGNPGEFYSSLLSDAFHPTYYALYVVMAMISVTWCWLHDCCKLSSRNTILYAISWIWLFIFLVLLSSKAGLISLAIPVIYMLYVLHQKTRSLIPMIGFSAFFALIFTASFYLFPISFGRFAVVAKTIETVTPDKGNASESTFQRIMLWKSAMRILREHPLGGVGTGDVKQAFLEDYTLTGNTAGQEANLNAHNQYLQTSVALGLTGLLILVLTFLFPFIMAFRKGAWEYGAFLLLVAFNLLFESMLERQAGVMFYAFFNMVLFTALNGEVVNHPVRSKPL
ncbi:MAG: hypothetical protein CVU06_06270 [Bacteroidetes bacterium HGW-Bacteroidetes-22]|nr:MAG: hypothetical protein CVU06_06270 [Bacteroidetes bacterium HGW-Bacteroidetes-22]